MTIPDFQTLMLPLLKLTEDGDEHSLAEVRESLSEQFCVTPEERSELLPSGQQPVFDNRVAWSKSYLVNSGLLEATRRAHFRITGRGRETLASGIDKIDIRYLERFPEFVEFRTPKKDNGGNGSLEPQPGEATPQEMLESAHQRIRKEIGAELLAKVKQASPQFFENLVIELLLKMGYGGSRKEAGRAIGRSGDEGIDGIINEDRLGLDTIYIQAKKWDGTVGRPEIQKFVGALHGKRSRKGVFITTGSFSSDAIDYVKHIDPKVVLIGGSDLAQLMIDFGVGVSVSSAYEVKRIDLDYFDHD